MRRATNRSIISNGILGGVAAFGYVVYPLVLAIRTQWLADPVPPEPLRWPAVSVVVPAYRERSVIAWKVENLRENGYPGALEIIVVAEDTPTADAARATGVRVIAPAERLGKAAALNLGVAAATSQVVVMTDANAELVPGAIASLARWFSDPGVGAVAGEKQVATGTEGVYWRFESWLKRRESRTGHTSGLVGELAAVRRDAYMPVPANVVADDAWIALDVIGQGHRLVYEPAARTTEEASSSLGAEWERRTRIAAGLDAVLIRRWRELVPGLSTASFQLWGHRFVRKSVGPIAHAVLVRRAVMNARKSVAAQAFLAIHAGAAVGLAAQVSGRTAPRPLRLGGHMLFLQLVALGGLIRLVRRDVSGAWPKPEREGLPDDAAPAEPLPLVDDASG